MRISFDGEFSPNDLGATLRALGQDVFFVQIGAMDGIRFDPIHACVEELGWKGILVEPIPDLFEQLKKNYASCDGLTFVNSAIADFEGTIEMTRIDPEAIKAGIFKEVLLGVSTLMPDRGLLGNVNMAEDMKPLLQCHSQTLEAPCCRLPILLKTHHVAKIDLLVIDTEGADWMVARQLPLDIYKPRIVYLEYAHLSSYEHVACSQHFRNHGYRVFIEKGDAENFLAVLK
jgi:FkbM family methyltransferase